MTQVHQVWKGLKTNASPTLLDAGYTVEQVNIHPGSDGIMQPRGGIVPLTGATASTSLFYTSMYFDHPVSKRILSHGITYAAPVYGGDLYAYNFTTQAYAAISQAGITCLNGFSPVSFFRDRRNVAFGVNGLGRGFRWDGLSASAAWLGIDAPTAAPGISGSGTTGGSSVGDYTAYYRYVDKDGYPSSLSPVATVAATIAGTTFSWSSVAASIATDGRASGGWKELYRSIADESSVVYLVSTLAPATTTYSDTRTDAYLTTAQSLPVFNVNGTVNANRFTPPPYHKPFAAMFKDRAFYYGGVEYSKGTIGLVANSASVTSGNAIFSGCDFSCGQGAGEFKLFVPGQTTAYTISSNNSTSLTLSTTYAGSSTSAATFTIKPAPVEERLLYYSEPDEPESVPVTNAIAVQEKTGDYDRETGLMPFGSYLYLLHERHIYPMTFVSQPDVDVNISPPIPRGCVNNRCWVVAQDHAYLIDQLGIYRIGLGGGVEDLGSNIQDKFQGSTFDWTQSKWWSASYEPLERVVRWYVTYTADSLTEPAFPKRCIAYDIDNGQLYEEKYPFLLSAPAIVTHNARTRLTVATTTPGASTVATTCLAHEGESDFTTSPIRGTVTASTSSTSLTDTTTAGFVAGHVGAPIAIVAGTGQGQIRRILSRTTTAVTVDSAWTTTPDTTSVYLVGAVEWVFRTGSDPFTKDDNESNRAIAVSFKPTTNAAEFQTEVYYDFASTASNWSYTYDTTEGLTYASGSSKATQDMKLTRSSLSDQVGWTQIPFPTPANTALPINRYMSVRLSGYKSLESQQIHTLLIEGVR